MPFTCAVRSLVGSRHSRHQFGRRRDCQIRRHCTRHRDHDQAGTRSLDRSSVARHRCHPEEQSAYSVALVHPAFLSGRAAEHSAAVVQSSIWCSQSSGKDRPHGHSVPDRYRAEQRSAQARGRPSTSPGTRSLDHRRDRHASPDPVPLDRSIRRFLNVRAQNGSTPSAVREPLRIRRGARLMCCGRAAKQFSPALQRWVASSARSSPVGTAQTLRTHRHHTRASK